MQSLCGISGVLWSLYGTIFIQEELDGKGWRRMAEVLWEFAIEGCNRGGVVGLWGRAVF